MVAAFLVFILKSFQLCVLVTDIKMWLRSSHCWDNMISKQEVEKELDWRITH